MANEIAQLKQQVIELQQQVDSLKSQLGDKPLTHKGTPRPSTTEKCLTLAASRVDNLSDLYWEGEKKIK